MSVRNGILLIIRQNPGIEYTSLLNKVAANYSSLNSARAALSRTLKDLTIYEMVTRKGNQLFVTEKAHAQIHSEMKNKLILKLNQLLTTRNQINEMDAIVEHLHTLIERGKDDARLIKVARGSSEFTIKNLEDIARQLEQRIAHLSYLSKVFQEQIESLKSLDFLDEVFLPLDDKGKVLLQQMLENQDAPEIILESADQPLLESASALAETKPKEGRIAFKSEHIPALLSLLQQHATEQTLNATLYASPLRAHCASQGFSVVLPHSKSR